MAAIVGPSRYADPLLPFEKQLAAQIGLTEEEYKDFREEVGRRSLERPAGYEHIPDVQAGPLVPVLISLAIGAAFTVVSALLAPKPREPETQERRQISGSDKTGPSRFNTTYGFESLADIAQWGDVIPISFGKSTDTTGGLLVTPKLVWSRVFSHGSHQVVKALYSCGEYGMAKPSHRAIYLGNVPVGGLNDHSWALYYKNDPSVNGTSRLRPSDLLYGSRGTPSSGDPETFDDIFSCPTLEAEEDTGFCYAYTPTNSTQFGFYSPLPNGTTLRTNWKVVSLPSLKDQKDDPSGRISAEREKICGDGTGRNGMPGVGRGYGRQMGICRYRSSSNGGWAEVGERTEVFMDVGWQVQYLISGTVIREDGLRESETGISVKDLNNASEQERAIADDQLQLGETIQIGRLTWKVIGRSIDIWRPGLQQEITLEAVEKFGQPVVVVMPHSLITSSTINVVGHGFSTTNHVGLAATPLGYQAMGIVQTVRPSDVVEVGIKSQVWLKANGLCNFAEVPDTERLRALDLEGTSISNGVMSLYMQRSSCFTVKFRPTERQEDGSEYDWQVMGDQFVIRGNSPVDQFNYVRFYLPKRESKYEFRFEPLPGDVVIRAFESNETFWHLDAANGTPQTVKADTPLGEMKMQFAGRAVFKEELLNNPEIGVGNQVIVDRPPGSTGDIVDVEFYTTDPIDTGHGKAHGWRSELLGWPQLYKGETRSVEIKVIDPNAIAYKDVRLRITATSVPHVPNDPVSAPGFSPVRYSSYVWDRPRVEVIGKMGLKWRNGDRFVYSVPITRDKNTGNNKWLGDAYDRGARRVRAHFVWGGHDSTGGNVTVNYSKRDWSNASQVADVFYHAGYLEASNDNSPEHEIVYVNEIVDNVTTPTYSNMTMLGLSLRSNRNITGLDQLRFGVAGGVQVERHFMADYFEDGQAVGRSNLFSDFLYFLLVDKDVGAGDRISTSLLDKEMFEKTSKFLAVNRIFCDMVLQDPVNIRQWASGIAPMMLCKFVVQAGQFGIMPAVPADESGEISGGAVPIAALFSEGNIVEGTFETNYFNLEERAEFKAVGIYRTANARDLPETVSLIIRYKGPDTGKYPIEEFDMSEWCTSEAQVELVCKYMLAVRKHVTHSVTFKTSPEGLNLSPGSYIKVATQSNPFSPARVGVVTALGEINSATKLDDGTYPITFYNPGGTVDDIEEGVMTVKGGVAVEPALHGVIYSLRTGDTRVGVYHVDQLTLDEDGMVEVLATNFPCNDQGQSLINLDLRAGDDSSVWWISK